MASKPILKYAFSILKQPARHSSIENTVFSIGILYVNFEQIHIYIYIITMRNYMASEPMLKYAFSILKQPARHSSIENTVFSIGILYVNVD